MKFCPKSLLLFIFVMIVSGCRSDSADNPRAYVEGRIISTSVDYRKFRLKIVSSNAVMAQTALQSGGEFKLSGPISDDGFALTATEKIKYFVADESGLALSQDSMQINVPQGITYIKFTEIVLKK